MTFLVSVSEFVSGASGVCEWSERVAIEASGVAIGASRVAMILSDRVAMILSNRVAMILTDRVATILSDRVAMILSDRVTRVFILFLFAL